MAMRIETSATGSPFSHPLDFENPLLKSVPLQLVAICCRHSFAATDSWSLLSLADPPLRVLHFKVSNRYSSEGFGTMTPLTSSEAVPLRTDEGGTVRVGNTRVSLDSVVVDYKNGATAEQIAFDYPTLDLADIHAAIAYYLRHREEVDRYLADRQNQAAKVRKQVEPIVARGEIRERLLARRTAQGSDDAAAHGG